MRHSIKYHEKISATPLIAYALRFLIRRVVSCYPYRATHRRASRVTQFRKVCRSKNLNGRP